MTAPARYSVHAPGLPRLHARILEEPSEEAAALAWLEDCSAWLDQPAPEISVIVRELESGREHCFRVDLAHGQVEPCG